MHSHPIFTYDVRIDVESYAFFSTLQRYKVTVLPVIKVVSHIGGSQYQFNRSEFKKRCPKMELTRQTLSHYNQYASNLAACVTVDFLIQFLHPQLRPTKGLFIEWMSLINILVSSFRSAQEAKTPPTCTSMQLVRDRLKRYFEDKYSDIGLLQAEDRPFHALYTKMSVTRCEEKRADGETIVTNMIPGVFTDKSRSVLIEGHAGSGKSTICRWMARDQTGTGRSDSRFDVVIMVELLELLQEMDCDITLQSIWKYYLRIEEPMWELLSEHKSRILWIFDGFDEIDSRDPSKSIVFNRFSADLAKKRLEWVHYCIISSRAERATKLEQSIRLDVKPWTEQDVREYVPKFFQSDPKSKQSVDRVFEILKSVRSEPFSPNLTIWEGYDDSIRTNAFIL